MNFNNKNDFHNYTDFQAIKNILPTTQETKFAYNFFNHFHPYVGKMIQQLNNKSLSGLFDPDFQGSLGEDFFESEYSPNKHELFLEVNYPRKELELNGDGAYSLYNEDLFCHTCITISSHLYKQKRYSDALRFMHLVFDPTSNDKNTEKPMRFWKFRKFREKKDVQQITDLLKSLSNPEEHELRKSVQHSIEEWRQNPFQPHVVARNRVSAYQLFIVMLWADIKFAEGDSYHRQGENIGSSELINYAIQCYISILDAFGPRPQIVPRMGKTSPKTYAMLKKKLDGFGNALVDMEVQFPFNLNIPSTTIKSSSTPSSEEGTSFLLGIAKTLYFCIPQNDKLLEYWDKVADRLFKIRHCMNIEGVVRELPLFATPIDAGMLAKATAAGIDIGSMVDGLNAPPSVLRTPVLIQSCKEIVSELKELGTKALAAFDQEHFEELALLKQQHEMTIMNLSKDIKFLDWKESVSATEALFKAREIIFQKYRHYQLLLGKKDEELEKIKEKDLATDDKTKLNELNVNNFDEVYNKLVAAYAGTISLENYPTEQISEDAIDRMASRGVEMLGVGGGDSASLHLNKSENKELNTYMPAAHVLQQNSAIIEAIASALSLLPEAGTYATPWGVGVAVEYGGREISNATSIGARILQLAAQEMSYRANRASKVAFYQRRVQDIVYQSNTAAGELMKNGRDIISSLIGQQLKKKEYDNFDTHIQHIIEIDNCMKNKITNLDFRKWMRGEIHRIFSDCYKFAFDTCRKAEQSVKRDLMREEVNEMNFIKFNWDNGRKGLLSGESLWMDLKHMEMAYLEYNKREYQITKHISLQQLDPKALLRLKATGFCEIKIPEWLFDMDCPGHYMRRINRVSLSIPCVIGPHTNINCTLSLLKSTIRVSPLLKDGQYAKDTKSQDERLEDCFGPVESIVTSRAQNDVGLFDAGTSDVYSFPFEHYGAESTWRLELPIDFKQFDYNSMSDVFFDIFYTARGAGVQLKEAAINRVKEIVNEAASSGLALSFSLRHNFTTEWYRFISSTEDLKIMIKKDHFQYPASSFVINVTKIELFLINENTIRGINPALIDLAKFNDEINDVNKYNQSDLVLSPDTEVLTRDKDATPFLVLSYELVTK